MTERKRPTDAALMAERARRLAARLVEAADDPAAGARRALEEEAKDRRDALIWNAHHAAKPASDPGRALGDVAALCRHWRESGHEVVAYRDDLRIETEPAVDAHWSSERREVRLVVRLAAEIGPHRSAELDEAIARANALSGLPIWRASPALIAAVSVPVAADGSVSSAEIDRALRILTTTVARDEAALLVRCAEPLAAVCAILSKLDETEGQRFQQSLVEEARRLSQPALPVTEAHGDPHGVLLGLAEIAAAESPERAARAALAFARTLCVHEHREKPPPSALIFAAECALAFQLASARSVLAEARRRAP